MILEKKTQQILQERGMQIVDELYKNRVVDYESKLYAGYESAYNDFFYDWDIIHPGLKQFEDRIVGSGRNVVAAVIGKSYVGKSCAAKRVLIDLRQKGFYS